MIAIIAALPREIASLTNGLPVDPELVKRGIHLYRRKEVILVAAGMGAARAAIAVGTALSSGEITDLLSVGLAGACIPGLTAGSVLEAHEVIDAKTGEHFVSSCKPGDDSQICRLVSTEGIASVKEKLRLYEAYGAWIVDMEAAAVGRLALAHGLRFRAIKGVSDEHDFELLSLKKFAGVDGSFRTGAFALHTALRPSLWSNAVKLGKGSSESLRGLDQAIRLTLLLHKIEF